MNNDFLEDIGFNGLYIPPDIFNNPELSRSEKEYLSLLREWSVPIANRIMEIHTNKRSVEQIRYTLRKKGCLSETKKLSPNDAKEMTIKIANKGSKCEWCGKESYVLQRHHFPISAKNGGTETVLICPNCHYTYHQLVADNKE